MLNTTPEVNCTALLEGKPGPPPFYSLEVRAVLGLILTLFPVLTFFGNTLVIVAVFTHKRLRTITNVFVVSLALADCMVALSVMPFGVYQQLSNKSWALGHTLCLVSTSLDVMFTTTSIIHLSCLAIDRYLAICRPFLHERLNNSVIAGMIVACWLTPILISFVPIMNGWNLFGIEDLYGCLFPDASTCGFIVNTAFAVVCSTIAFYLPTIFMIVCNVKIFLAAEKQAKHIRSLELHLHKHQTGKLKRETKAAKTISIIMGCFCVCWFPFFILNIIDPLIGYKIPYIPWTVALWLGYLNSMLNPFLYYNFNRAFRIAFRRLLTFKVCRGVSEFEDEYVSVANLSTTEVTHNGHSPANTEVSNPMSTELSDLST
ncbi:5-hydroxytryptamine receptor 4-like [Argopecten irradians]|uniref:5-hydroxytryptamine receptor 4-like n=1 Tax=Argopecten irradians TaxID=31199 RepID=UPI003710BCBD